MTTQLPQPNNRGLIQQHLAQQQTMPHQAITLETIAQSSPSSIPPDPSLIEEIEDEQVVPDSSRVKKQAIIRIIVLALAGLLGLGIYFIWHTSPSTTSTITQQPLNATTTKGQTTADTSSSVATNGQIQVYIVGAVKHPGVYTMQGNARLHQLLEAAGGPLPDANLLLLNLAGRLSDGQEVYVARIGETPPSILGTNGGASGTSTGTSGVTTGQLININTASADDLRQGLHISSTTAQAIITYRMQHGAFTSVEQLSQVVSKAIYNKIKGQVTVA